MCDAWCSMMAPRSSPLPWRTHFARARCLGRGEAEDRGRHGHPRLEHDVLRHAHALQRLRITNKDPSLDYRSFIISRVVDGVRRAVNNLEPARIAWGSGKVPQHVFNRRWLLKEGVTNPNPFGGKIMR
jgi:hypothetical protein